MPPLVNDTVNASVVGPVRLKVNAPVSPPSVALASVATTVTTGVVSTIVTVAVLGDPIA